MDLRLPLGAQPTVADYVAARPTPAAWMRWWGVRHLRWLIAVIDQDERCNQWRRLTGGVPDQELLEAAWIDAIWRGEK